MSAELPATVCLRCAKTIAQGERRDSCFGCEGDLCGDCWEDFSTCIAPACIEAERAFVSGSHEERSRIASELFANPKKNEH